MIYSDKSNTHHPQSNPTHKSYSPLPPLVATYRKRFQEHQTLDNPLHRVARQTERAGQMATLSADGRRQRRVHQRPSVTLRHRQTGRQRSVPHEPLQRVHSRRRLVATMQGGRCRRFSHGGQFFEFFLIAFDDSLHWFRRWFSFGQHEQSLVCFFW